MTPAGTREPSALQCSGLPSPLVASHLPCLRPRSKGFQQIPTLQICPELFSSYILPSSSPNLHVQPAVYCPGRAGAGQPCLPEWPTTGEATVTVSTAGWASSLSSLSAGWPSGCKGNRCLHATLPSKRTLCLFLAVAMLSK